jgi:hypothetical protein
MKRKGEVERIIAEQWPKLKRKAQNETDPVKLIAIVEEIDDLLFLLEMRIAEPGTVSISLRGKTETEYKC